MYDRKRPQGGCHGHTHGLNNVTITTGAIYYRNTT